MSGRPAPRSRRETRAVVLETLLRRGGAFRPHIARDAQLTEASVSRILAELRKEEIVDEIRQPAPYAGGPTALITLSNNIYVAGIELSNNRLSFSIGDVSGTIDYVERVPVSPQLDQAEFERIFTGCLATMGKWTAKRGVSVRQAAFSLPGYSNANTNPIFPWDMERLRSFLSDTMQGVPLSITNSVIAQAAFHRYSGNSSYPATGDHLFLFVGHGVAGVIVNESATIEAFSPFELGHMVLERNGLACRCGHHGCLEAYTSLRAISKIVGVSETEILQRGDRFLDQLELKAETREQLRERLFLLGLGTGNALNLHPLPSVVISGWPSLLAPEDRQAIIEGMNESLLGGFDAKRMQVSFIAPSIGTDPQAALNYAAYCFVRAGGLDTRAEERHVEENA
ncbi:ROK family transcriptional regulator [Nitratireductor aestuarii]|uniref:ROK family transcriptional regulator n=1 Tax=Nitratireductor aestuarii TaxID=1735103 RepID=UPI00166EC1F4|nr:ROK family transcriptional regulator [Nitratireductor aestuarii]